MSDGKDKKEFLDDSAIKKANEDEKKSILGDLELVKRFDKIGNKLKKNADLRDFRKKKIIGSFKYRRGKSTLYIKYYV